MTTAATVEKYLKDMHIPFEVVAHARTGSSLRSATAAHVPAEQVAKGVLLEDDLGYVMAVLPAHYQVHLGAVWKELHRKVSLATEQEVAELFKDCDRGAVPPVGEAYGIETIVDNDLAEMSDVYFEAGDHQDLIHMRGDDFMRLHTGARRGHFCALC